jgi:hypothetical protein
MERGSYETIEALCEETLTLELAAKRFEFTKHRNVFFKLLQPSAPIHLQFLNHFWIQNAFVERNKNPP